MPQVQSSEPVETSVYLLGLVVEHVVAEEGAREALEAEVGLHLTSAAQVPSSVTSKGAIDASTNSPHH